VGVPEAKVRHVVVLAIFLIFFLELVAIANGMNGTCMRLTIASIAALAGVGGGWGLEKVVIRRQSKGD
jgi:uncharacterized membrane protein